MKILRLYINLPPLPGGMEKHIYNLSVNQIAQENDVTIVFNQGKVIRSTDIQLLKSVKLYKIRPQFFAFFVFYLFSIIHLAFNKQRADIIHIHGDWSSLFFKSLIKKITHAKMVCFSFHGEFSPNRFTHSKLLIFLLKNTDVIFVNGYEAFSEIKKRLVGKKPSIIWRPSGISSIFNPLTKNIKNKKPIIISVARLVKRKNIEFVLSLAKLLKEFAFYIVGDGPEKKNLIKQIKTERIPNVYLLGKKSEEELVDLLNSSDLFLLPSLAEGTSTAIIEAMACGLPIICSNAGGIKKLIKNEENGFVLDSFIEKDYLEKIRLLINSHELREKIKKNNIEKSKGFYWENVSKEISILFENTLTKEI